MTKCQHSMPDSRVAILMGLFRMLPCAPGLLGSGQMVLFSLLLFRNKMGVFRRIVQLHGPLFVFIRCWHRKDAALGMPNQRWTQSHPLDWRFSAHLP